MKVSKSRFINWTRCPMYLSMELMHNPTGAIDIEKERQAEMIEEVKDGMQSSGEGNDDEHFDIEPSEQLKALLPFYRQVEDEALKVAKRYFNGTFVADSNDVHNQRLFEYERNGNTYSCYVDIYNENEKEINIIEVKATTCKKFIDLTFSDAKRGGNKFVLFVKKGNFFRLNTKCSNISSITQDNFKNSKSLLLDRYRNEGKYPHDLAFQRFVIENALREAGDNRKVNFYLAVLNSEYFYDGTTDEQGNRIYNCVDGQEIVTFIDMNDISREYQETINNEIETLEGYIKSPHNTCDKVDVGKWCAWKENTECLYLSHCFNKLRSVPESNRSNNYLSFHGFKEGNIKDKYHLINDGYYKLEDVPGGWLTSENHKIQRDCYDNKTEHIDKEKMRYWFDQIEYPIYHFDFESFACPLPRFKGENPYRQSVFEFSLHIERKPGVCDKENDNFIFLNQTSENDEREDLAKAIVDNFEFNADGKLHGTMLAQNTSFERGRLTELAKLYPQYSDKLLAIRDKSMDLIHLLKTNTALYKDHFGEDSAKLINYYHPDLSGSYSIKKTLPVLVSSLTYKNLSVGNGVQAYIAYINYDSPEPTYGLMTKDERRKALKIYCQQDTWAMVEILRAVRDKIK